MEDLFDGIPEVLPAVQQDQAIAVSPPPRALPLEGVLPEGFNLQLLLTFIPDVRLKARVSALALEAVRVDVTQPDGLREADEKLAQLKDTSTARGHHG